MPALFIGGPNSFIGGPDSFVGGFNASTDVNVTLTGIALGTSQGAFSYLFSKDVATQLVSLSQSSVTYLFSKSLTGQLLSLNQGALSFSFDKALTSSLVGSGQGNLTLSNSLALTGIATNLSQGALAYVLSKTLNTQIVNLSQGAVTATIGADVSATLSGIAIGIGQGNLTATISTGVVTRVGGGINWQTPRKAVALKEKPLRHLDFILKNVVAEVFGELTADEVSEKVKTQAQEIVKEYQTEGIISQHFVTPVDWEAFSRNANDIQRLIDLWESQIKNARIEEFNRMYLLLLN